MCRAKFDEVGLICGSSPLVRGGGTLDLQAFGGSWMTRVVPIRSQLLPNWNDLLQMSPTGCPQTDSKLKMDKTELLWVGLRHCLSQEAVFQYYNLVLILLQPVTLSIYSA